MDTNERKGLIAKMDKFIGEMTAINSIGPKKPMVALVRVVRLAPLALQIIDGLEMAEDPDSDPELKARFDEIGKKFDDINI